MAKRFLLVLVLSVLLNAIFAQQRIPMQLESSGIYTIPCEVNGLKLRFVFDTGASDVHLSLLDAAFMVKNGYLKKEEFFGKDSFFMADGSISENTIVNLKEIKIGNTTIYNVRACISSKLNAALLLGQSAIKKIGKYAIDNNCLILYGNNNIKSDDSFKYQNGDEYIGETENGLKHGKGKYVWGNGNTYKGQWIQDKRHGYGTLYYKNGDKYIGNWVNDKKEGRGVMITADGNKYVGEWKAGLRNGYGTLFCSDGKSTSGYWKNDKLVNPK